MKRGVKVSIAIIAVIVLVIVAGYAYICSVSGLDSPLSVVMSSSMQHDDNESRIGVIDTGDIVVVKDPKSMTIQSYVEATVSGYKSLGDYGDVIIYERGGDSNPIIHRAIVWVNYNAINNTWSIPSLANYEGIWKCSESTNYMSLSGTLTFIDITQSKKTVSINLNDIKEKRSGYLTLGDNPVSNREFDQSGLVKSPVGKDLIKSVAIIEIPWMGVLKVSLSEKSSYLSHVPNSIYSLVMLFIMLFSFIYCYDFVNLKRKLEITNRKLKELG